MPAQPHRFLPMLAIAITALLPLAAAAQSASKLITDTAVIVRFKREGTHVAVFEITTDSGKVYSTTHRWRTGMTHGAKYLATYNPGNPRKIDLHNLSRPVFAPGERTEKAVAQITGFSFGKGRYDWIEYSYFAPALRDTLLHQHISEMHFDGRATDTAGIRVGNVYEAEVWQDNAYRSILNLAKTMPDSTAIPHYDGPLHAYESSCIRFSLAYTPYRIHNALPVLWFKFSDPGSGAAANELVSIPEQAKVHVFDIGFDVRTLRRKYSSYAGMAMRLGAGNDESIVGLHINKGWEYMLTRQPGHSHFHYPYLSALGAVGLSYMAIEYRLGSLTSVTGNDISIKGRERDTLLYANYRYNAVSFAPEAGLSLQVTERLCLRFSALYNVVLFPWQRVGFSSGDASVTDKLNRYVTQPSGAPITRNLVTADPLTFRFSLVLFGRE